MFLEKTNQGNFGHLQKKYGILGDNTLPNWLRKYGKFDWRFKHPRIYQNHQNNTF